MTQDIKARVAEWFKLYKKQGVYSGLPAEAYTLIEELSLREEKFVACMRKALKEDTFCYYSHGIEPPNGNTVREDIRKKFESTLKDLGLEE